MKDLAVALLVLFGAGSGWGQPAAQGPPTFTLWENGAPGTLGTADEDRPTLTRYQAPGRSRSQTAVVIAPGGGYAHLAMDKEGRQVASWFNGLGVTAFVLQYRLGPRYHHPVELGDAQRAIRLVRSRAAQYGIAADRIGMMGFSAGGHLSATAGTHFDEGQPGASDPVDRASSRPDFLILAYPVISFDPAIAHAGSVQNLLGDHPDAALLQNLSNELHVTSKTPPTFLFHTSNDSTVPVENSIRFYLALRKAKIPAEMHIFENGPHGVGLASGDPELSLWPTLLANWLRGRGLLAQ
ncbi:MAG: alpha/beta hydrolase [Acidobacteriia bacterium]|nr:alpha/beta hydrolase [Terriglobia bacterium]